MSNPSQSVFGRSFPWAVCALIAVAGSSRAAEETAKTGEQIYKQTCVRCHGANGEGTKKHFPHPLVGDKNADQLATYIAKSMPEDDPGTVTGADAKKVAAFVFESFYSPTARTRNTPARIELSRLTVKQY